MELFHTSLKYLSIFLLSWFGVLLVRLVAARGRLMDVPNERSSHHRPTPRGGGIAIVAATVGGVMVPCLTRHYEWLGHLLPYTIGALTIAAVSWMDDLTGVSSRVRFGIHSGAALLAMVAVGSFDLLSLPFLGEVHFGIFGVPIAFLWMAGLTNAFNFMDGIDGIAASQATIAGMGWAVLGILNDMPVVSALGFTVAVSSLGFLVHNWPPARIFMGDVGSAFLGYTFAFLCIAAAQGAPEMALCGLLLVWPFVLDTSYTLYLRWKRGENIFVAHRSHLYQRLVRAGYSHRRVTLLYAALAGAGFFLALCFSLGVPGTGGLIVVTIPLLFVGLIRFVKRCERIDRPSTPSPVHTG